MREYTFNMLNGASSLGISQICVLHCLRYSRVLSGMAMIPESCISPRATASMVNGLPAKTSAGRKYVNLYLEFQPPYPISMLLPGWLLIAPSRSLVTADAWDLDWSNVSAVGAKLIPNCVTNTIATHNQSKGTIVARAPTDVTTAASLILLYTSAQA